VNIRLQLTIILLIAALPGILFAEAGTRAYAPGQVLVRFSIKTTLSDARRELNGPAFSVAESLVPSLDIYLVKLNGSVSAPAAVAMLKGYPHIRWAQLDHFLALRNTVPNDPQYPSQWNYNQLNDADIDAPEAWDVSTGGTDAEGHQIVVAVVDNGCYLSQPDLAANLWVNSGEIPNNGIDDDGDGYIDDVNGWNAYNDTGFIPVPGAPYHGTHVAGIIGAMGNNGLQVCGINWHVKLMIVAASSTQTSVVSLGYNFVIAQKTRWLASGGSNGADVVVTNSSFGVDYGNCLSDSFPIWNDLYNEMGSLGILSSCATANINLNVDVSGDVPTGCSSPYIIAVTNTNNLDQKYNSAAYGRTMVDLGAPGTAILSTVNTGTATLTGTSMASPHVAGAVALMHAAASSAFCLYYTAHPDSGALLLKQMLLASVDPLPHWDTLTVSGGRLNLFNAVTEIHNYAPPQRAMPSLVYANQRIEDSITGNNDRSLESGETSNLFVTVANYGEAAANVWGTLSTDDTLITVLDNTSYFGDITADSSLTNALDLFTIRADSATPLDHSALMTLTLTADSGYTTVQYFTIQMGQTVIYWLDSMEAGENGWTHESITPNSGDAWHLSTAMSASPTHSWKCGDTATAPYASNLDAGLISPPIAVTPQSSLYFSHWMDAEVSGLYSDSALDGGIVEISANNGAFVSVAPEGGYSRAFRMLRGGAIAGVNCFSGMINWVQRQVDLNSYAGDTIRVRFRFSSDSAGTAHEGWYVDDVFVRGRAPVVPSVDSLRDVVIVPAGDDIELHWTPPASGADRYVIFRTAAFDSMITSADSIGGTVDTFYVDTGGAALNPQAFYVVKAARP
jgi:hypothetical protein